MQDSHLATAGGDLKVWESGSFAQIHSVGLMGFRQIMQCALRRAPLFVVRITAACTIFQFAPPRRAPPFLVRDVCHLFQFATCATFLQFAPVAQVPSTVKMHRQVRSVAEPKLTIFAAAGGRNFILSTIQKSEN